VVEAEGEIEADANRLLVVNVPGDTLRAFDGQLRGKSLRFGAGKSKDAYVENWSKPNELIAWPVRLNQPATFDVMIAYDAEARSAGGSYTVRLGRETLAGTVTKGENVAAPLGRVRLPPGIFEIQVVPGTIQGNELMRLRSLRLTAIN
jgi:hypothetical protein